MQYESIWEILRENNFIVDEVKESDLICRLCKKLLIEAKQAPCACKFCAKCIEEYLSNGNSICPGNTSECNDEILQINENISNDYVTNRRISKLKLKCPTDNCAYEDILSNMNQHLMQCGKQSVACPFSQFGCNQVNIDKNEIVKHFKSKNYEHAHLMMEIIKNLTNEIEFLKNESVILKENSDRQQSLIENFNRNIEETKELYSNDVNIILSIDLKECNKFNTYDVESSNCKEFIWTIDSFSLKMQTANVIDSDEFYAQTNDHKIQLRMLPHVKTSDNKLGVSIYPNRIRSSNDICLQWPIKCEITIGIINQRTGFYFTNSTQIINYSFNKSPIAPFKFQMNNKWYIENDRLVVKCLIKVFQ